MIQIDCEVAKKIVIDWWSGNEDNSSPPEHISTLLNELERIGITLNKETGIWADKDETERKLKQEERKKLNKQFKELFEKFEPTDLKIDLDKLKNIEHPSPKTRGVIIPKICNCGKYKPKSTKGLIDLSCSNCGGEKRQIIFK